MRTLKVWNVKDAYTDQHFSRNIDKDSGYTTKTVLAAPILINKKAIGVIEVINKSNDVYDEQDEETMELCANFCSMALQNAKNYKKRIDLSQEITVLNEMYVQHSKPRRKELRDVHNPTIVVAVPDDFYKFSFNFYQSPQHHTKWAFVLSKDILEKCQVKFCENTLIRFLATVRKNYRDMPYHNWNHAFSVAHFTYIILQTSYKDFSKAEVLALFFGALCHDLDHRGRNNAFYILTNHPLSKLYEVSVLENHHYYMTKNILARKDCDIFSAIQGEFRNEVLEKIKDVIIATDLLEYFKNRNVLGPIVESGTYSWKNSEHRKLACCLIMTNSDLCGSCKPYEISKMSAIKVFEEFYSQGDEEKELGFTPIPMFTRKDEMALNQAGFLNAVVLPCVIILKKIIPSLTAVEDQLKVLLDQWEEYAKQKVEKEISEEEIQSLRIPGSKLQENSLTFVQYKKSN